MKEFELKVCEQIKELDGTATLFEHSASGASVITIENEDHNKVFCIGFRTPCDDSTGIAHILEHCVLCGSPKYPLKDPFFELLKGSMNTFINAMTARNRTYYPLASTNHQDFLNQMDVYLDLVLRPLLRKETFMQEGWHLLPAENGKLALGGIVYNEMKGAYSDPQDLLGEVAIKALLPDTNFAFDSGGDPIHIPELTYEAFLAFHKKYYHPSNAIIILYGNIHRGECLEKLNELLQGFNKVHYDYTPPIQPRFSEPVVVESFYNPGEDQSSPKAYATTNWLLGVPESIEETLERLLLDHILLMRPSSPLRRALIESGLGEGIAEWGISDYLNEQTFATGLRGVRPEDCVHVENLILSILHELVKKGIEPEDVEASLNQFEFALRENNSPLGLKILGDILSAWTHNEDIFSKLKYEGPLKELKDRLQSNPRLLEQRIQKDFLSNTHRVHLRLLPDASKAINRLDIEAAFLREQEIKLSVSDKERIARDFQTLRLFQETPNSPEDALSIPRLQLKDIEREIEILPSRTLSEHPTILATPVATQGIAYSQFIFRCDHIPNNLLTSIPLFCAMLREAGLHEQDYISFDREIARNVGNISAECSPFEEYGTEATSLYFTLKGKALLEKSSHLYEVLGKAAHDVNLENKDRALQIVRQARSSLERSLIPSGHSYALRRAAAAYSITDSLSDTLGGIVQLQFLRELDQGFEAAWPELLDKLHALHKIIFSQSPHLVGVTAEPESLDAEYQRITTFLKTFKGKPNSEEVLRVFAPAANEFFDVPADVNYSAQVFRIPVGSVPEGAARVVFKHVGLSFLHALIREQGGAYGAFGRISEKGVVSLASYRDPALKSTFDAFDGVGAQLRNLVLSADDLKNYIIGCISDASPHLLPAQKGSVNISRHLAKITDQRRQEVRDEILNTSAQDFRRMGELIAEESHSKKSVTFGPKASFEEFRALFPNAELRSILG
jgi:Zn-dependent M16 (insulinase) family peptidase